MVSNGLVVSVLAPFSRDPCRANKNPLDKVGTQYISIIIVTSYLISDPRRTANRLGNTSPTITQIGALAKVAGSGRGSSEAEADFATIYRFGIDSVVK